MYANQAFSSGSYSDMFSGSPLLPPNYNGSVGGPTMGDPACNSFAAGDSHVVPRTQMGIIDTDQNAQCQGLSLSLGTLMPPTASVPPFQYQYNPGTGLSSLMNEANLHKELRSAECMASSVSSGGFHDSAKREGLYNPNPSVCIKDVHSDPCLQGSQGFSNTVLNSQYLKAAQELLDEIANVRKALKQTGMENKENFRDIGLDGSKDSDGKSTSQSMQVSSGPNGSNANPPELSPGERQSLLEKKTKLLVMLDEVDKRYRQYYHQMQIVVSSFDMVAGCGAAEPYTTLALRTISRHFRCLRDAISGQIQVCQRSLGEQEGIPRLRNVDQQLRQQKALQHLGVMRQAWRPQRGLPENSVSILRAWLFEHFLHPYPKDSEKIMLARQTGLTRNQVANWFINARVRLWKPMVEEMYKEEFGDSEITENMLKGKRDDAEASDNKGEESQDNLITVDISSVQQVGQLHGLLKPEHASSSTAELDRGIQGENCWMDSGARKMQGNQRFTTMNNNDHHHNNNNSLYSCAPIPTNQNGDGSSSIIDSTNTPAAAYDLSELGNFTVGGHVSLALELRNCESDGFAISDDAIHKRRSNNQALASSSPEADLLDYHFTDSGKQQHRFSSPHLLHEFVV